MVQPVEDLYFSTSEYERWALEELTDYNSQLNREARRIVNQLRRRLGIPVFFRIWTDVDNEKPACPNCGRSGSPAPWEGTPERVCRRCKLAFFLPEALE